MNRDLNVYGKAGVLTTFLATLNGDDETMETSTTLTLKLMEAQRADGDEAREEPAGKFSRCLMK